MGEEMCMSHRSAVAGGDGVDFVDASIAAVFVIEVRMFGLFRWRVADGACLNRLEVIFLCKLIIVILEIDDVFEGSDNE